MNEYRALMDAKKILFHARLEVLTEDGTGAPAWLLLFNAENHIMKQATAILRSDDTPEVRS